MVAVEPGLGAYQAANLEPDSDSIVIVSQGKSSGGGPTVRLADSTKRPPTIQTATTNAIPQSTKTVSKIRRMSFGLRSIH